MQLILPLQIAFQEQGFGGESEQDALEVFDITLRIAQDDLAEVLTNKKLFHTLRTENVAHVLIMRFPVTIAI